MKPAALAALIGGLCWLIASGALAGNLTTDVDGVRVELNSSPPVPIKDRKIVYTLRLSDSAGKPLSDARVTLTARMADGMSAAAPLRSSGAGVYHGEVLFTMQGPWELTIRIIRPAGRLEIPLREEVGR